MKKEREIIEFETEEEFLDGIYEETEGNGFKEIDIEKLSFDGEKGMVEERIIYQRISDGKYFDAIVYRGSAGNVWFDDLKMTEVFKKTVKKTMYE